MKSIFRPLLWVALIVPVVVFTAQRSGTPSAGPSSATNTTGRVVAAASAFLATLGDAERTTVMFDFNGPQRTGWSNLPSGIFTRQGLRLGDLTPRQRDGALALVASALSRDGYQKVLNIMN